MMIKKVFDPKRNSRHAEQRRILRRKNCFDRAISTVAPEVFLTEEVGDLFLGTLVEAKRAWRRAERRQAMTSRAPHARSAEPPSDHPLTLPRPVRILSRLNRSAVFPPLVPAKTVIQESSVSGIMEILRWAAPSMPAHRMLDALATASGFSWKDTASILAASGIIQAPIPTAVVEAVQQARNFWSEYSAGRERFSNLVANGAISNWQGDWASFEHNDLERALPGIVVPTRLRRHDYVTNAIWDARQFSVDVHAGLDGRPLFRHPFPDAFNPLYYGRPHNGDVRPKPISIVGGRN